MAKDKRVKGCPNLECQCNQKKFHYKVNDSFCSKCGYELVLVCCDCFKKLDDQGPKHIRCGLCEAKREDRKQNFGKKVQFAKGKVADAVMAVKENAPKIQLPQLRKKKHAPDTLVPEADPDENE